MKKNNLEEMLDEINKVNNETIVENGEIKNKRKEGFLEVKDPTININVPKKEIDSLGVFDKIRTNTLMSKKKIEAQEVIFDTQISRLKHEAEATERQSKAYWDAKSVDFSEGLKTYAQKNMQMLENARLENKSSAIIEAYSMANDKMCEVIDGKMPEVVKRDLVQKIVEVRDLSVSRIESDVLANKYDLGSS